MANTSSGRIVPAHLALHEFGLAHQRCCELVVVDRFIINSLGSQTFPQQVGESPVPVEAAELIFAINRPDPRVVVHHTDDGHVKCSPPEVKNQ